MIDPTINIVPAAERDVPLILSFIKGLAEYERLLGQVVATEDALRETLFGPKKFAEVVIARYGDEPAGFALFFHNYSTFLGQPGIYLEDLFVLPEFRKKGVGKALLTYLSRVAVERKCGRLEWAVLDWNKPVIEFYEKMGAVCLDDWRICRLTGMALKKLGSNSGEPK
ncbi:MAG TPA: GNAT family N-acetyltransferase [Candidatus Acidoferrales bacterium]|nr:GNAT family N-acetyltransferase [Candidatus Acidoferrales bacterium]